MCFKIDVLALILFNIYTNDQPTPNNTKTFTYADDVTIAVKGSRFEDIEEKLEIALNVMSTSYKKNSLKLNPTKTQVVHSRQANRKFYFTWDRTPLKHTEMPAYLGIVLDRTLTYKYLQSRNSLIRNLTTSMESQTYNGQNFCSSSVFLNSQIHHLSIV